MLFSEASILLLLLSLFLSHIEAEKRLLFSSSSFDELLCWLAPLGIVGGGGTGKFDLTSTLVVSCLVIFVGDCDDGGDGGDASLRPAGLTFPWAASVGGQSFWMSPKLLFVVSGAASLMEALPTALGLFASLLTEE